MAPTAPRLLRALRPGVSEWIELSHLARRAGDGIAMRLEVRDDGIVLRFDLANFHGHAVETVELGQSADWRVIPCAICNTVWPTPEDARECAETDAWVQTLHNG